MSERMRESLSALMDDEANELLNKPSYREPYVVPQQV